MRTYELLADEIEVSALGERFRTRPYGLAGGGDGAGNRLLLRRAGDVGVGGAAVEVQRPRAAPRRLLLDALRRRRRLRPGGRARPGAIAADAAAGLAAVPDAAEPVPAPVPPPTEAVARPAIVARVQPHMAEACPTCPLNDPVRCPYHHPFALDFWDAHGLETWSARNCPIVRERR